METLKSAANANDQSTMTPAMGGDRGDCLPRKMRTFAEILNEEQNYRNILEVKLIRLNVSNDCGELVKARGLTEDDIRDAFKIKKNRNMGHCPKRWEGVKTGSQIFHIVQMGHKGVGGRGS